MYREGNSKLDSFKQNEMSEITKTVASHIKNRNSNNESISPVDQKLNSKYSPKFKIENCFYQDTNHGIDIQGYIRNAKLQSKANLKQSREKEMPEKYGGFIISQMKLGPTDEKRYGVTLNLSNQNNADCDSDIKDGGTDTANLEGSPNQKNTISDNETAAHKIIKIVSKNQRGNPNPKAALKTMTTSSNEYNVAKTLMKNVTSDSKDTTLSGVGIKIDMNRLSQLNEAPQYKKKANTAYDGFKRRHINGVINEIKAKNHSSLEYSEQDVKPNADTENIKNLSDIENLYKANEEIIMSNVEYFTKSNIPMMHN